MTDKTTIDIEAMRDDLMRVRDELRLQLHLAGMDTRTAFQKLEAKIDRFDERVRMRHPVQELVESFAHLKGAFTSIRDSWRD